MMLIAILLLVSKGYAEPLVGISWDYFTPISTGEQSLSGSARNLEYAQFSWYVGQRWHNPEKASESVLGLQYTRRTFRDFSFLGSRWNELPENLYSLQVISRWTRTWKKTQQAVLFMSPVYENASEKTSKRKDFKFAGGGLILHQLDRMQFGIGFAWSRVFGRAMLIPLGAISWRSPRDNMAVRLLLPLKGEIKVELNSRLTINLEVRQQGGEYRADKQDAGGDQWIEHRFTSISPAISFYTGMSDLHLFARGGLAFAHRLVARDENRGRIGLNLGHTWMAQVGFFFGVPVVLFDMSSI